MIKSVSIIKTGVANTASVKAAFEKLDCHVNYVDSKKEVLESGFLVLPGVGSFSGGMKALEALDLVDVLKDRINQDKPTLCICLGLQLLFSRSQESPGVKGLSIFEGEIVKLSEKFQVPQFGWNAVMPSSNSILVKEGYAYFANSFCLRTPPSKLRPSFTNYDGRFVSAFEHGNLLACQFHPELSGFWGLDLLKKWVSK